MRVDSGLYNPAGSGVQERRISTGPSLIIPPKNEIFRKERDPETGEVKVTSSLSLEAYRKITPPEDWHRLMQSAEALRDRRISFVNATAAGGGVAIMRTAQRWLMGEVGVDAHWYVMDPDPKAFDVTKGWHNTLQGVADHLMTDERAAVHEDWTGKNAIKLVPALARSDVVVIDDPQPTGLFGNIRDNSDARIIYRHHIQTDTGLVDTEGTAQNGVWKYIWERNRISEADCFVFHPVADFVPGNVPLERTVYMPPSTDHLDGLNRPLTNGEIQEGLDFFNACLTDNENQIPLDPTRPYFIQIARFDPAKGIPHLLEAYSISRRMIESMGVPLEQIPQLVIAGNGSVDDPDGIPILNETMRLRKERYGEIADDIKVARMPHNDQALNALLRMSFAALQLSTREGFEYKVTEALLKGKPVIAADRGGIPLQVVHGESGFVVDPEDEISVAKHMLTLALDNNTYTRLSEGALRLAAERNHEFTTIPNVINWFHLFHMVLEQPNFRSGGQSVRDMVLRNGYHPA